MERELKKEDGNLSKLRAKLNDLSRDNGSARGRGSQRALESLYAALQATPQPNPKPEPKPKPNPNPHPNPNLALALT